MNNISVLLLVVTHVFASITIFAQDTIWPLIYEDEVAYEVFEDYDGGFLIMGATTQYNSTNKDYGIIKKTDINGGQLWQKYIGAAEPPGWTTTGELSRTSDDGYIITGFTRMYNGRGNTFVMKLNSCFEKEWSRLFYSDEGNQASMGIHQLEDNSYLMHIDNWGDDPLGEKVWVFKLSETGKTIWNKTYANWEPGKHNAELAQDFIPDNHGNYFLTGKYYKQQPGTDTNYFWIRPMFIKIDTAGNEMWNLVYDTEAYLGSTFKSCVDNSGALYSSGYNSSFDSVSGDSPVIYKVNDVGEMEWFINLAFEEDSVHLGWTIDVSVMNDSVLYTIGGWSTFSDGGMTYVFKVDTAGNFIDRKLLPDYGYYTNASIITSDNKYMAVGFTNSDEGSGYYSAHFYKLNAMLEYDTLYSSDIIYDSLCPHQILSDTIALDTLTVNLDRLAIDMKCMSVFPNPAKDKVRVEINVIKWKERQLQVFNISGRKVYDKTIPPGRANHEMDVTGWIKGLYLFRIFEEGRMIQSEKLLIAR